MSTRLEIACCNYLSCHHAWQGGADRIELFESLADGGCTPSFGMMKWVKQEIPLPIYAMIRPRGGDFCYSSREFDIMQSDIEICHQLGIDGIVFGILTEDGRVDEDRCRELQQLWRFKPITFHRAIDRSKDILRSATQIANMGFERILTSGGHPHVQDGLSTIKTLIQHLGTSITIMPGAGVTSGNVKSIVDATGAHEIHATAKRQMPSVSGTMNPSFQDQVVYSDLDEIIRLRQALNDDV